MADKWKDLVEGLPTAVEDAISTASRTASRESSEALNQAVRRVAQTSNVSDALAALVDSTPLFCAAAAVLSLKNGQAQAVRTRGTAASAGAPFDIASAPALASMLESKEPVAAASTPGELSPALAETLGTADGRAYLFPLKVRQEVVAALAATGSVQAGAMECVCEAASLKLEILLPPPPPPPPTPPPPQTEVKPATPQTGPSSREAPREEQREPSAWDNLPADVQRIHLQAQRFARVKVAELRLYHAEAVREGRGKSDLYGVLRMEIDKLRNEYKRDFAGAPAMVDYLHLELLRTLAHDDDRLLGPDYPGPVI